MRNTERPLEKGAKMAAAAAAVFKNPKAALPTMPDVIIFYPSGKGSYVAKNV